MATYKVLQDIEAEDKLLGPLTLKQFIFAIITVAIGFIIFKIATTTALSVVRWPFVIVLFIPMLVFGFLAAPISRDQPNDVWLLARVRFLIKPHVRIWNQDGLRQLVTITAPQHTEIIRTNGLDQTEVRSRLTALANTLDSRGWAVKNVDVNLFAQPDYLVTEAASDRLVAPSSLPTTNPTIDVKAADDILDASSNPTAQHLDQMVHDLEATRRQTLVESVRHPEAATNSPQADYWFMNQPAASQPAATMPNDYTTFQSAAVVTPGSSDNSAAVPTEAEQALITKIEAEKQQAQQYNQHTKVIQPLRDQAAQPAASHLSTPQVLSNSVLPSAAPFQPAATAAASQPQPVPPTPSNSGTNSRNPAILSLASNDDLNVATIARQAKELDDSDGEVVISLH